MEDQLEPTGQDHTQAMKLGGISPNIIHELSGVYPNFVKAFKEVITNSYDADATNVKIIIAPEYDTITVTDNGRGMSIFEFQNDYLRLGSSTKSRENDKTESGRLRIGCKGIGFLALARYCESIELVSHTDRPLIENYQGQISSLETDMKIKFIQNPLANSLINHISIQKVKINNYCLKLGDYEIDGCYILIPRSSLLNLKRTSHKNNGASKICIDYKIETNQLVLVSSINFERILNLRDDQNLENLIDFANVALRKRNDDDEAHYTKITLHLHRFIQKELRAPRKQGRVRNIASSSGIDKFIWHLSRNLPIGYSPKNLLILSSIGMDKLNLQPPIPFVVFVEYAGKNLITLSRPFLSEVMSVVGENTISKIYPILVETEEIGVVGYLVSYLQPVFPAELRGIAVRVRGVEIGTPGLWGADKGLPVKYKPLLDHVLGELIVTRGIDAISTIMAGREGFYEESKEFQKLCQLIIGDGLMNFGPLGQVLDELYERISSESSVERIVQETRQRREAFLGISKALSEMAVLSKYGRLVRQLFSRHDVKANGLSKAALCDLRIPQKIGRFTVEIQSLEEKDFEIDIANEVVILSNDVGNRENSLYIMGRDFEVKLQNGQPDDPVCEVDLNQDQIYINWMHPTRGKMGDVNFIKSALSWRIAYLASKGDIDIMMNIAHRLLL